MSTIDRAVKDLAQLNGASGDPNLILNPCDDPTAVGWLAERCGRPLPVGLRRVLEVTSLAPTQLGSVFFEEDASAGSHSIGYAQWAVQLSDRVLESEERREWLFVAHGDPFQCVLSLLTGEVFAWASGASFDQRFALNCDLEQLIVAAVAGLVDGDPVAAGAALRSPERFWALL